MDLNFLTEYVEPVIMGICLCVGFIIKQSLSFIPNKYIPLIIAVLGLSINVIFNKSISTDIALQGLFSGLVSTGLYEMFRNIINNGGKLK